MVQNEWKMFGTSGTNHTIAMPLSKPPVVGLSYVAYFFVVFPEQNSLFITLACGLQHLRCKTRPESSPGTHAPPCPMNKLRAECTFVLTEQ